MPRLSLGDLEAAQKNPRVFRQMLDTDEPGSFGETYVGALRQTIFYHYHRTGDPAEARAYLEQRMENSTRLRSVARRFDTLDQLDWYVEEHRTRGWVTSQAPLNIEVSLRRASELRCSGQIGRIDLVPSGGYAGWLFINDLENDWKTQLRFPVVQHTLATQVLDVATEEIHVGVYDLQNRRVELTQYSSDDLTKARKKLGRLVKDLGY